MAKKTFIRFRHVTGSLKNIPGVANKEDLQPRMEQIVTRIGDKERPVLRLVEDYVPKIMLLDEETDTVRLTETEKKLPAAVQERILARRAEEADLRIRANEMLKQSVKYYEDMGAIKVIDWKYEVDEDSPEAKGTNINQLSEIALADFADRGLEVPAHLKKVSMPTATTDKSSVVVKQGLTKKPRANDD